MNQAKAKRLKEAKEREDEFFDFLGPLVEKIRRSGCEHRKNDNYLCGFHQRVVDQLRREKIAIESNEVVRYFPDFAVTTRSGETWLVELKKSASSERNAFFAYRKLSRIYPVAIAYPCIRKGQKIYMSSVIDDITTVDLPRSTKGSGDLFVGLNGPFREITEILGCSGNSLR